MPCVPSEMAPFAPQTNKHKEKDEKSPGPGKASGPIIPDARPRRHGPTNDAGPGVAEGGQAGSPDNAGAVGQGGSRGRRVRGRGRGSERPIKNQDGEVSLPVANGEGGEGDPSRRPAPAGRKTRPPKPARVKERSGQPNGAEPGAGVVLDSDKGNGPSQDIRDQPNPNPAGKTRAPKSRASSAVDGGKGKQARISAWNQSNPRPTEATNTGDTAKIPGSHPGGEAVEQPKKRRPRWRHRNRGAGGSNDVDRAAD